MKAWEQFLARQEELLGIETVDKWLRPLQVVDYNACNLYLEAKDSFQILWFEEHMRKKVESKLLNNNKKKIQVHLNLTNAPFPRKKGKKSNSKNSKEIKEPAFTLSFDELDPHFTFPLFVTSESNILPYKLLNKLTSFDSSGQNGEDMLSSFNPIYLHGPAGTGKTHLMQATAHALKEKGLSVLYTRAETFTEHVVSAIRAGEMSKFRNAYRHIDILLIDDVHLFSRKGATQEELFHTFNTLHLGGKQILLSANCSPAELQMIEPRLVSRFEWGVVLPIELLKPDEVQAVFEKKTEAYDYPVPPKIVQYLKETFSTGTKSLINALQALILRLQGNPHPLTISLVKHTLADLIEVEERKAVTPQLVVSTIAEHFGIRADDIQGKAQTRECALPRQMAMYVCRDRLKLPYTKIGELFGRDHSTVMSSVKIIQKGLKNNDKDIAHTLANIAKSLNKPREG